jgi:hypothetical protein
LRRLSTIGKFRMFNQNLTAKISRTECGVTSLEKSPTKEINGSNKICWYIHQESLQLPITHDDWNPQGEWIYPRGEAMFPPVLVVVAKQQMALSYSPVGTKRIAFVAVVVVVAPYYDNILGWIPLETTPCKSNEMPLVSSAWKLWHPWWFTTRTTLTV